MGKIQCPNCKSFDTSTKMNNNTGCGCMSLFLSFIALGGGAGAAEFYGGTQDIYPIFGSLLLIFGIVMVIYGQIQKSRQNTMIIECKNCKNEFEVE